MGCGAAVGGADGGLTLDNCTFIGNVGGFFTSGGAVCLSNAEFTVTNCVFIGNEADRGGGMGLRETNGTLTNCLFSGNSGAGAYLGAGGLDIGPGNVGLTNCVFSGNSTGIRVSGWQTVAAEATLTNCILWDNGGTTEEQQIEVNDSYPSTVQADYSCIQGWTGEWEGVGTIDDDPLFVDPDGGDDLVGTEDDDLRLSAGSPCIDAGDNLAVPVEVTTDLDDHWRFLDDPETPDTGQGGPPIVDMGPYEFFADDCNENGIPDRQDIGEGTSTDCNENGIPDGCIELELDCNANLVPDACDIAEGTSQDCTGNGIPDECEPDCNTNGVADSCDILEGTSEDCQPNEVPDECDLSQGTSHDHDNNGKPDECERTNRYLTFAPQTGGPPVAYQVEMISSAYFPDSTGIVGWADEPFELTLEPGSWVARVTDTPFYTDSWPELLHVGDCQIVPVADYLVRPTEDGINFGDPLELSTIAQPVPKYWADVVGAFDGTEWSGPNEVVNMDDVVAAVQKFKSEPSAPPLTWVDVDEEVPNLVLNFTDILRIVSGFKGQPYPFRDPAECGR